MEFLKLQVSEQRGIIDELTQVRISLSPPGSWTCCMKCKINELICRVCPQERDRLVMSKKHRRKPLKLPNVSVRE